MKGARETRYYCSSCKLIVLATESRIAAWNAVHQTTRREADVRISVLTTGIDDVKTVECELQRTFVRGAR